MNNHSRRQLQTSELIKRHLLNVLSGMLVFDQFLSKLYIARVDISKDLKNAIVYYRVLDVSLQEELQNLFNQNISHIQHLLLKTIKSRSKILLRFIYDNTKEVLDEVESLRPQLEKYQ